MKRFDGSIDILTGEDIEVNQIHENFMSWGSVKVKINGRVYTGTLEYSAEKFASLCHYVLVYNEERQIKIKTFQHFQVYQLEILEQYKAHDFSASFFA